MRKRPADLPPQRRIGREFQIPGFVATAVLALAMTIGLTILLLAFAGKFKEKVPAEAAAVVGEPVGDREVVAVKVDSPQAVRDGRRINSRRPRIGDRFEASGPRRRSQGEGRATRRSRC